MASAEFWYEFASSYSYPAAMRIGALAEARCVRLIWRPFLLGPVFAAQGLRDSPFNLYPVKGRYMWRDLQRICESLGLPLRKPDPFPQSSLLAARVSLALDETLRPVFTRAVYAAEFGEGRSIGDRTVIAAILGGIGADAVAVLSAAGSDANKTQLRSETARASEIGIFGAPSLITPDGELFWGNDRLEQGLDWAAKQPALAVA